MAELSQVQRRDTEQQEKIGRRTSIVSERRNTRAPALETNANMRQARRGSGNADQLLRALGMAQEATGDLQGYMENQHVVDERENIAQGAADQATGMVDEAMMEKSDGYRNAVTQGRTITQFNERQRKLDEELRGVIEQQDQVSLEERQAEVSTLIEAAYQDFAADPETGELREYLQSPGAMRYLAGAIQETRPKFMANAMSQIEERFNEEALNHYGQNLADQALQTGTVDFGAARALLPDTVSDEQVAETTILATNNAIERLEAEGRIEEAAALLAGLRGYADKPLDTGTGTSEGTGTVAEAPAAPAGNGRISFDTLAASVMHFESRGNPNAVSPVGAEGTMQVMPATQTDPGYGVTPARDNSPEELERVGRDYLKAMLKEYDGDYVKALAAYNAGPGTVNRWIKEGVFSAKGQKAKIDAIPYEETRKYAANVLGMAQGGEAPAAAPVRQQNLDFRLTRPEADPVTLFEQSGEIPQLAGLEDIQFSAEQTARISAMYDRTTARLRSTWEKQRTEDQAFNAATLTFGLLGEGAPVTMPDIARAVREGEISPEQAIALTRLERTEEDRRIAAVERAENRRDREEARRQREEEEAMTARLLGPMLRGEISPGQARSDAFSVVAGAGDPLAAASSLRTVLGVATAMENGTLGTDEVRGRLEGIDTTLREQWSEAIKNDASILGRRRSEALEAVDDTMDEAQAYYSQQVMKGKSDEAAWEATASRYLPRLQAIPSRYAVPNAVPSN